MPRTKVKFAFIENDDERKASYKKRQKGFLKKAYELSTLCDVEMAIVVYSSYHDVPKVFPNHANAINIFTKFMESSALEKSKNMMTQEEFTKKRIKKIEEQLRNTRKKNRVNEFTNKIYDMLNGKNIPTGMHPHDLNDLSYVINQTLKQVEEAIKGKVDKEGSILNAPQPISGLMVPSGINFEGPRDPPPVLVGAPVSMVPSLGPSVVLGGTNSEGTRAPLLFPCVAPISLGPPAAPTMVPSASPMQVAQSMFLVDAPLMTLPQTVPLVDPSWVSPSPHPSLSFSSQIFPSMIPQMYPPIPLQTDLGMVPSIPQTTITSPMPPSMMSPSISAPMFPQTTSQVSPSMNISQTGALISMNNYQNYFVDFPQSPTLSEMLDWNDDDVMALFDNSSFNNINIQDPNLNNNF